MKKIPVSVVALAFALGLALAPVFALPLSAEPADALSVTSTRWFDIIYPPRSAGSAALLAEYADGFASEICSLLQTSMKGRIPVYLDPSVEVTNAYFSPAPYNRIFIYDTVPTDGSLAGFRDSLLSVFYHELTHAVSLNIRSPFWQTVSTVFSDALSVNSIVTMPKSFIEGVTVSFESLHGEGRLNDPLTRHYIVQDKIEGKFLGWKEAAGALDVYPGAKSAYLYGGAFSSWLQTTYGMEKYAELWKRGGSFNPFFSYLQTRFRQVYGLGISDAWSQFRDSVPVPANIRVNRDILPGTGNGVYSALASGPDGVFWADADSAGVWFRESSGAVIRLFDSDGYVNRLAVSPDGRYLLASGATVDETRITRTVRVFDIAGRRFLDETYPNLRDASFAGNNRQVCAVENVSQRVSLVVFERGVKSPRRVLLNAGPGEEFANLYNPVYAGPGRIACIAGNGLDRSLLFIDVSTGAVSRAALPEHVRFVRFLQAAESADGPVLTFSWADTGTLYRYAIYRVGSGTLELQEGDFSGGVFYPVLDPAAGTLAYVASYSGYDALQTVTADSALLSVEDMQVKADESQDNRFRSRSVPPAMPESHFYNPLPWFLDGVFLPFVDTIPVDIGEKSLAPGFLYATGDPAERYSLLLRPFFTVSPFFADFDLQAGRRYRPFLLVYNLYDNLEEGIAGFSPYRDLGARVSISRDWHLGATWKTLTLDVTGQGDRYAPDIGLHESPYQAPFDASALSLNANLALSLVRGRKIPAFPLFAVNRIGMTAEANGWIGVLYPDRAVSSVLQGKVGLLPPGFPLSLTLSGALSDGILFGPQTAYAETKCVRQFQAGVARYLPRFAEYAGTAFGSVSSDRAIGGTAELTLLSFEIQKGVPVVPLYANRVSAVFGYRGAVFGPGTDDRIWLDSAYCRASVSASVVIGALTDVVLSAGGEYAWAIRAGCGTFIPEFFAKIPL